MCDYADSLSHVTNSLHMVHVKKLIFMLYYCTLIQWENIITKILFDL